MIYTIYCICLLLCKYKKTVLSFSLSGPARFRLTASFTKTTLRIRQHIWKSQINFENKYFVHLIQLCRFLVGGWKTNRIPIHTNGRRARPGVSIFREIQVFFKRLISGFWVFLVCHSSFLYFSIKWPYGHGCTNCGSLAAYIKNGLILSQMSQKNLTYAL